jgi:N6-adenosine-specific RNA methylase IME4
VWLKLYNIHVIETVQYLSDWNYNIRVIEIVQYLW